MYYVDPSGVFSLLTSVRREKTETSAMLTQELAGIPLFEGLPQEHLDLLAPLFRRVTFPAGTEIFTQGDDASDLFLLVSGDVRVQVSLYDGGRLNVTTVQPGGLWGWSAVLGRTRYTASAVCRSETHALAASGIELRRLIQAHADFGKLLVERMAQLAANRSDGLHDQLMKLFEK